MRSAFFCLRQSGTRLLLVFGFSAQSAEKPNTDDSAYHAAAGRISRYVGYRVSPATKEEKYLSAEGKEMPTA